MCKDTHGVSMNFLITLLIVFAALLPHKNTMEHQAHMESTINGCATNTVWNEAQTWWSQPDQEHVFESSHIHLAACWPLNRTLTGIVPIDLTVKTHNLRGSIIHIAADVLPATKKEVCFDRFSCMDVPANKIQTDDVTLNYTFNVDTRNITRDGWHQLRIIVQFARDDIPVTSPRENIQTTVSFMAYIKNGNPIMEYTNNTLFRASGHYWMHDNGERLKTGYEYAKLHKLPVVNNNILTFSYSLADSADPALETVTDYAIMIDPNIHGGSKGIVVAEGATTAHGVKTVNVDVTNLVTGTHTLAIRAGADILARPGAKLSGVTVVRFTK